jgi:hypothetical protein
MMSDGVCLLLLCHGDRRMSSSKVLGDRLAVATGARVRSGSLGVRSFLPCRVLTLRLSVHVDEGHGYIRSTVELCRPVVCCLTRHP